MANSEVFRSVYRQLSRYAGRTEVLPSFPLQQLPRTQADVKALLRSEFQKPFTEDALKVFSLYREVSDRASAFGYNVDIDYEQKFPAFLYTPPLFPGNRLKLHIFEPRYRILIRHAHDNDGRFIYMIRHTSDSDLIGSVAVLAQTTRAEFMDDGKANVEVLMGPRVKVTNYDLESVEGDSLRWLNVEPFQDKVLTDPNEIAEVEKMRCEVLDMFDALAVKLDIAHPQKLMSELVYHYGSLPLGAEALSLWASSWTLPPGEDKDRQEALASDCTLTRLQNVKRTMENLGERKQYTSSRKKLRTKRQSTESQIP